MRLIFSFTVCVLVLGQSIAYGQTLINTSFEDYTTGSVFGQGDWIQDNDNDGSAEIVSSVAYAKTGSQGLKISSSTAVETVVDHLSYGKTETGISGNVYVDFWIKIIDAPASESIYVRVFDLLPDNGLRRASEIRIYPEGNIKVANGGSKVDVPTELHATGEWTRISLSVDYAILKYEVAINGTVINQFFEFRESYDAVEKGRTSGIKEFHGLRFWYEDAIADVAIDDVYIGTDAIEDIDFTAPSTDRTITVTQPDKATITLDPQKDIYQVGDVVTATLSDIADHYKFEGWTGSFSGTDNPLTINISGNVSLGAQIVIDESDPPNEYTIEITQPTGGVISVSPDKGPYYEGSVVTFSVSPDIGYTFDSWTGISGTKSSMSVEITENLTVSAVMTEGTYSERKVNVTSSDELENALEDIKPGDRIILADGTYDNVRETLDKKGGTANYPVSIEAANLGMAKITGESRFYLEHCAHITFSGIEFDVSIYTLFKLTGCNHIRLSRNVFKNTGDDGSKLIIIGDEWEGEVATSHHNRIDHNLFDGKTDVGAWVVIDGTHGSVPQVSQYDRIDHNHFRNNGPRVTNEKETIRVGLSDLSLSSGFCTIENNLFEACDGDPEIISIKCNDNFVRNNTFRKSLGTVSLRHGNRTEVSGNFFFGEEKTAQFEGNTIGCGGVRVYGKDHKIFNNYFEGLTGSKWDAACTLTQGDASNDGVTQKSNLTKHYVIENLEFTHNTLINNQSDIEIGYRDDWGKAPINVLIANNIIMQNENPVTKVYFSGTDNDVSFSDNIVYTTGNASDGDISFTADEANNTDPMLELSDCKVPSAGCNGLYANEIYKISSNNSPAVDPSPSRTISEVTTDIEGQDSKNARDLGADEYNETGAITNGALDARHVGPNAVTFLENDQDDDDEEVLGIDDEPKLAQFFPNPFSSRVTIKSTKPVLVKVFGVEGQMIDSFPVSGSHFWNAPSVGLYFAQISSSEGKQVIRLLAVE